MTGQMNENGVSTAGKPTQPQFRRFLVEQNMSEQTIKAYSYAVKQFYGLYPQLTDKNLQLYKVFLIERYKPQTVNLRLRAMNCFVRYRESSLCPVSMVHVQQKGFLEQIISQADYEFLKQRLWEDGEYNYYFLIRLMTATGVRISELVLFDVEDVKKGYRDIYSKGNKLRRVYIPAVLRTAFKEWPGFSQRPDGILFLNRFGAPLSASGIRFQLKVFAARYGIDPDVMYPHSFRHRFAKNFIEVCPDIALLSDLLGHDSIETTRIYLRRSSREQYRIVSGEVYKIKLLDREDIIAMEQKKYGAKALVRHHGYQHYDTELTAVPPTVEEFMYFLSKAKTAERRNYEKVIH